MSQPGRFRGALLAVVSLVSLGVTSWGHAEPLGLSVTLVGPTTVTAGITTSFGGAVTASALGIPSTGVDVLVDGEPAASTTTRTDGTYVVSLALSRGRHDMTAFVLRGTALTAQSPVLSVTGGPEPPTFTGTTPTSPNNLSTRPLINGSAERDATVRIYTTTGCTGEATGSAVASGAGSFTIPMSVPANAKTTFRATATDAAGNGSLCSVSSISYVHDTLAPAAPTLTATTPVSPNNTSTSPSISASVEPGSTIRLYATADCTGDAGGVGLVSDAGDALIAVQVTANSSTVLRATATDAASNTSPCSSSSITYVHDSLPPSFTGVTSAVALSDSQIRLGWGAASDNFSPAISITYDVCWSTSPTTCIDSFLAHARTNPGATAYTAETLEPKLRYYFVVRARDAAGNQATSTSTMWAATDGIVEAIAGGRDHTCAIVTGGAVRCWGNNDYGQLGDGTTASRISPVAVSGISNAVDITGSSHTCAIISGGTVRCWGGNSSGQLGDGTATQRETPVQAAGVTGAVSIAAGLDHTCVLVSGGAVGCWGNNDYGQLGDGSTTERRTAVAVSGISDASAIATGWSHTCAIVSGGAIRCWGDNHKGQLGDGTSIDRTTPVVVSGISGATAIAAGGDHTCAIVAGGALRCWGLNHEGQLGNGSFESSRIPVTVQGVSGATGLTAGVYDTCALFPDGSVACWGLNNYGQLGNGTTSSSNTAVSVSGLSKATAIRAGALHTCAVRSTSVACWGANADGRLGDGTLDSRTAPVTVNW